jgi:hypothetical protein
MEKTQVYLRKEELEALRKAAARTGRSIAELIRDAIRKVVLKPQATGPRSGTASQNVRPSSTIAFTTSRDAAGEAAFVDSAGDIAGVKTAPHMGAIG